ncbi:MAG: FG-GAP-like repeat-containing protein, partial [Bacteroidales bacterium]|nr:FG-GAP-like repeat-containing protein [Bacteroidales bacterium]
MRLINKLIIVGLFLSNLFIQNIFGQYCIPNPTSGALYDTYIDSVSLGDIDYQDAFSPTDTSYNDYTSAYHGQTMLTRSSTYTLTIKGSPFYNSMHYVAWIDYNNDYDFTDSNEKLGEVIATSANQVFTILFTVPTDVDIVKTRLRVRGVLNTSNPDPCTDYLYGETEDYLVSISDFSQVGTGIDATFGSMEFFNYNTDNDYDIILHDESSTTDPVLFYYNTAGSFSSFSYLNTPFPEPNNDNLSFNLCDLNSDNQLDAIFTYRHNSNQSRTVYYEKQTVLTYTATSLPDLMRGSSAAADLNNDGRQDVVICGQDDDGIPHTYIYENTEAGLVLVNDELVGVYGQILIADYDNDMDMDLFLFGTDQYSNTNAIIYKNDNNWKFTNIYADIQKTGWLGGVALTDINNDGLIDLAVEDKIYNNNGDNSFSEVYVEITDWLYDAIHFTDLDNDGMVEMISQDGLGVVINKNNGLDSFLIKEQLFVKGENIDIGDSNNDDKPDIIVNHDPEIAILENNISFSNSAPSAPLNLVSSIGDSGYYSVNLYWDSGSDDATPAEGLTYNLRVGTAPGKNDIVSSMTSTTYHSLLKPGMGNVYFNTSWYLKNLEPGTYYWTVQSVDNTQVASAFATEQSFEILAPFTESSFLVDGQIMNSGTVADFDGDGDMDILLRDSLIAIHEQTSPYNFSYHIVDSNFTALEISDLNHDNLTDIIGMHW